MLLCRTLMMIWVGCRTTPMRIEPKTFFANERTFLTWMHMAVTIGTIAAALLGFSGTAQRSEKPKYGVSSLLIALLAAPKTVIALVCMFWGCSVVQNCSRGTCSEVQQARWFKS